MGGVLSFVWSWWASERVEALPGVPPGTEPNLGKDADVPDPNTGLTPRHVIAISGTWDLVRPDLKGHGINFFITLFQKYPVLQTRFKGFQGKTLEQLRESKRLHSHAYTVMSAITGIVDNLGDLNCLIELLKTTGRNHKKRGIDKGDFELLAPVLIKFLGDNLAAAWSPIAEEAWTQAMKTILTVIFSGYDIEDEE